ncbi:Hypothetical protein, putative [Bodo saltans]|uniref:Uncharacterized protein n=1 Tax=Bodo saltans TaxID=75058 RepID=A0A0S4J2Y2_BODSA|nr:Hypothetical protein, putative [Bodo saltans]|eukprot:CUG71836.1 Hypothetical protein, putative [Bodo saltans]
MCKYASTTKSLSWVWNALQSIGNGKAISKCLSSGRPAKLSVQNAIQRSCAPISILDVNHERLERVLLKISTYATTPEDVVTVSHQFLNLRDALVGMSRYATTPDAVVSLVEAIRHVEHITASSTFGDESVGDAFILMSRYATSIDAVLSLARVTNTGITGGTQL